MKKINTILGALVILFAVSCEGPTGPPGPPGFDGNDGFDGQDGIQGQVVEVQGVNFGYDASANLYSVLIPFIDVTNFEVLEEDAVLVYRFDGVIDLDDGSTANAWSQLPQNFFLPEGTLQYVFAHTFVDVELFIDGNFDLSGIDVGFTDNQTFRIVIVPSIFNESSRMDTSSLTNVMAAIGVQEDGVVKMQMN